MGYLIELSINIKKNTNISELKETVKTLAKKYNCSFMYDSYEYIVNNRYYFRNHCIITMEFPDDDANLISFINSIKKNKKVKKKRRKKGGKTAKKAGKRKTKKHGKA